MLSKLTKSKTTGLASPIILSLPWEIIGKICSLCVCYGAELKNIAKGKKSDKVMVMIEKTDTAKKVFNPLRFNGTNYLAKRKFESKVDPLSNAKISKFKGSAEVVCTKNTPIQLEYNYELKRLTVTFYIQRYQENGFVIDSSLQKLMNESSA